MSNAGHEDLELDEPVTTDKYPVPPVDPEYAFGDGDDPDADD